MTLRINASSWAFYHTITHTHQQPNIYFHQVFLFSLILLVIRHLCRYLKHTTYGHNDDVILWIEIYFYLFPFPFKIFRMFLVKIDEFINVKI